MAEDKKHSFKVFTDSYCHKRVYYESVGKLLKKLYMHIIRLLYSFFVSGQMLLTSEYRTM